MPKVFSVLLDDDAQRNLEAVAAAMRRKRGDAFRELVREKAEELTAAGKVVELQEKPGERAD